MSEESGFRSSEATVGEPPESPRRFIQGPSGGHGPGRSPRTWLDACPPERADLRRGSDDRLLHQRIIAVNKPHFAAVLPSAAADTDRISSTFAPSSALAARHRPTVFDAHTA